MATCSSCGLQIEAEARFCPNCGQPQSFATAALPTSSGAATPAKVSGGCVGSLVAIFIGMIFLLLLFVGGIVGFIFYRIKDSEPAKLAVQSLKQSPATPQTLGELQKTGWPIGSISVEGGGSGQASFTMSVQGSKAKGKYFATLKRVNGVWRVESSRLQLADGTSVDLGGSTGGTVAPREAPVLAKVPVSGGQALRSDSNAVVDWREVDWPGQGIHFKVPAGWVQEQLKKDEVSFRNTDRTAYFFGHITYFNQKLPFAPIVQSIEERAAGQLKQGETLGYARKDFGKAVGFVQIQRRGDGATMVTWSGYFDVEGSGTVSVDFVGGAPTPNDFDKVESTLGAILDSVQVK